MNILRYSIICFVSLAIILMAGYSYCLQDRDSDKDYNLARNYGPGWVIPSVLDASGKVKMDESTQKLNDLENHLTNNPNKDNSSDPVLQKKKGGGSGTNKVLPNNVGLQDTMGNILMGTGTDQRDINGALLSESGGKLYSEVINGTRMVYAGFGSDSQEQNAKVIQDAVDYFARHSFTDGGKVLVRGGAYDYSGANIAITEYCTLNGFMKLSDGVSVYGGYDDNGNRDINAYKTTITGGFYLNGMIKPVEIDGFTFKDVSISSPSPYNFLGGIYAQGSYNLVIANNDITNSSLNMRQITYLLIKNNKMNNLPYYVTDRDTSSEFTMENNIISGNGQYTLYKGTMNLKNNIFTGDQKITSYEGTINSSNNNYLGECDVQWVRDYLYSSNDYFGGGTIDSSSIRHFFDDTRGSEANNLTGLTGYTLQDNPLYSADGIVTNPTDTTAQFTSIFSPSYYPDKLFNNYGLNFDQYNNLSNNPIQVISLYDINLNLPSLIFGLNKLNPNDISPGIITIDLGKFTDSYISILQGKLDIPTNDIATLQDTILVLETKDNKTDAEENLLEVAKILEENNQYLDDETLKEFNQIARVVEMTEDMKDIMKPEDLISLSKSLQKLVEEERGIYSDYLTKTQDLYNKLVNLLGISVNDENLPDIYTSLSKINASAKRKMIVDRALEKLKTKDKDTLTDNEKEALKIDQNELIPAREEYTTKLKMSITTFSWEINSLFKVKSPVSISKDESGLKSLILLDRNAEAKH